MRVCLDIKHGGWKGGDMWVESGASVHRMFRHVGRKRALRDKRHTRAFGDSKRVSILFSASALQLTSVVVATHVCTCQWRYKNVKHPRVAQCWALRCTRGPCGLVFPSQTHINPHQTHTKHTFSYSPRLKAALPMYLRRSITRHAHRSTHTPEPRHPTHARTALCALPSDHADVKHMRSSCMSWGNTDRHSHECLVGLAVFLERSLAVLDDLLVVFGCQGVPGCLEGLADVAHWRWGQAAGPAEGSGSHCAVVIW